MKKKFQSIIIIISTFLLIISGSLMVNVPVSSAAESISVFKGALRLPTNVGVTQPYKGTEHKGIDYAGNPGERGNPIYAVYDGIVKNAGDSGEKGGGFGNWIVIEHKSPSGKTKLYSVYGHMELKDIAVKVGQKVNKGQQIAKIGNAGTSTGPHLHFALSAVYPKLSYIDPTSYFEKTVISNPEETAYNATAKIITPSGLNVRKSASATAERIGGVYKNDTVTIVAKAGDFYKIKFGNGYGYISNNSSYLTIIQNNGKSLYTSYKDLDLRLPSSISATTINNWIKKSKPSSKLLGTGQLFINAQNKYGVNAVYLVAHAMVESSWGTSYLAKTKKNIYGQNAYDSNPNAAYAFKSYEQAIMYQAYIVRKEWLESNGNRYNGPTLVGMNKTYASDTNWANAISGVMNEFEKFNANNYNNKKIIPVNNTNPYK